VRIQVRDANSWLATRENVIRARVSPYISKLGLESERSPILDTTVTFSVISMQTLLPMSYKIPSCNDGEISLVRDCEGTNSDRLRFHELLELLSKGNIEDHTKLRKYF
jgi:hypothetical protein